MIQVIFTLFVLISTYHSVYGSVPVLILESFGHNELNAASALTTIETQEFKDYISKKIMNQKRLSKIIVFLEDVLSVEDFSYKGKDRIGNFPGLESVMNSALFSEYFQSVSLPLEAIQSLAQYGYIIKYLTDRDKFPEQDKLNVIYIVKLSKRKNRAESLHRHDKFMVDTLDRFLKVYNDLFALYTGINSSWQTYTLAAKTNKKLHDSSLMVWSGQRALSVMTKYPVIKTRKQLYDFKYFPKPIVNGKVELESAIYALYHQVNHSCKLYFQFTLVRNIWSLICIKVSFTGNPTEFLFPLDKISASIGTSWHSSLPVVFISNITQINFGNERTVLEFKNLQIELFPSNVKRLIFNKAIGDIGFFTIPIWEGIFVLTLLLLIMAFGIVMIMDIRVHDKFDSDKTKPLPIYIYDE